MNNNSREVGISLRIFAIFNETVQEDVTDGMVRNDIPHKTGHTIDFFRWFGF